MSDLRRVSARTWRFSMDHVSKFQTLRMRDPVLHRCNRVACLAICIEPAPGGGARRMRGLAYFSRPRMLRAVRRAFGSPEAMQAQPEEDAHWAQQLERCAEGAPRAELYQYGGAPEYPAPRPPPRPRRKRRAAGPAASS